MIKTNSRLRIRSTKKLKAVVLTALFAFSLSDIYSQKTRSPLEKVDMQLFIEELVPVQEEDVNYEEIYETLLLLYQNPLNLNKADKNELQSLFILSEFQINNFFTYKNRLGPLLSIYELQAIPGFDLATIYKLLPFVYIEHQESFNDMKPFVQRVISEENNLFIMRYERTLEDKKGYLGKEDPDSSQNVNHYLGNPGKFYSRFRINNPGDFSLGFTAENDAGEPFTLDKSTKRYGFDYYSYHFQIKNRGHLKNLVIGDYQVQIGQSLLVGAGFIVGKGAETINTLRRSTLGIRPYTSVVETGYFRGIASTFQLARYSITAFYSNLNQDGNVQQNSLEENSLPTFSSVQSSGLHRTPNEIKAKNTINEQVVGTNLSFRSQNQNLEAGITFLGTLYDANWVRTSSKYNQYEFEGDKNYTIGTNISYNWQNFNFFGEGAYSKSGGSGIIAGMVSSLSPIVDISFIYRNYQRNFHSFYGRAFSENTRNINEEGIYMGLKIKPVSQVVLNISYDRFKFPWLKYRVDAPSNGHEFLSRLSFSPNKLIRMYAQHRVKEKGVNVSGPDLNKVNQGTQHNYIFNLEYSVSKNFNLRSRVQSSSYRLNGVRSSGFILAQDFSYDIKKFTFSTRYALFETDDYQTRQYAHEKDVLYAFSIPAYYGRGARTYFLVRYKFSKKLNVWFRYAKTQYNDRDEIGSGLEKIEGNTKTDLKVQMLYKL